MYVPLGQTVPTIPWQCWESAGFKACHATQWAAASNMCAATKSGDGGYEGDRKWCIEEQTYRFAREACFQLCQSPPAATTVPKPMTAAELEEAGVHRTAWPWQKIAVVGLIGGAGILLLSGVLMGRDYERKRARA